jgi:hypothetical protein
LTTRQLVGVSVLDPSVEANFLDRVSDKRFALDALRRGYGLANASTYAHPGVQRRCWILEDHLNPGAAFSATHLVGAVCFEDFDGSRSGRVKLSHKAPNR